MCTCQAEVVTVDFKLKKEDVDNNKFYIRFSGDGEDMAYQYYVPIYELNYNGKAYHLKGKPYSERVQYKYSIGQKKKVIFNPENPEEFLFDNFFAKHFADRELITILSMIAFMLYVAARSFTLFG